MNCPNCAETLVEEEIKNQQIDRCPKCNGIYFDKGELESLVGLIKTYESIELEELDIDLVPQSEKERKLVCPRDGAPMIEQQILGVVFDQCTSCEGIWLDGGEISALKILENHIRQNLSLYIKLGN